MHTLFKIPFMFLVVGGCIGLLLRWHFVSPFPWLNYSYWLHGHSHIMFLGWIFNLLLTAYLFNYSLWQKNRYRVVFWVIQGLLVGMLISFPMQGYGAISIGLSVLHTFCIWIFTVWFFKDVRNSESMHSIWCARVSLLLFALASIGPFLLGVLKANGLGNSPWYYNVVYYYLHFQYNGVFIFGVLSLWFNWIESKQVKIDSALAHRSYSLLLVSLFPSYFLSILWSKPPIIFNVIGLAGAGIQMVAFFYFARLLWKLDLKTTRYAGVFIRLAIICFGLKCVLQLVSAHPVVAQMALEVRPFLIAYLHLVVIGTVSLFLLAWCIEMKVLTLHSPMAVLLVVIGFFGTELLMIFSGVTVMSGSALLLFLFSCFLLAGCLIFTFRVFMPSFHQ